MLTRDGERVLELLLLAACIAVTVMLNGSLALSDSTRAGPEDHGSTSQTFVPVNRQRQVQKDWLATDAKAPAELIDRMLGDAATRLAELEGRISRC